MPHVRIVSSVGSVPERIMTEDTTEVVLEIPVGAYADTYHEEPTAVRDEYETARAAPNGVLITKFFNR